MMSYEYAPSLRRIVDRMKELRPIVETGYENILLVRLLIEEVRYGVADSRFWKHHGAAGWRE